MLSDLKWCIWEGQLKRLVILLGDNVNFFIIKLMLDMSSQIIGE
jgi:hypothetical protein